MEGLIIDSFAGGGGASKGIEMALGRSPDVAINHDEAAVCMHMANHPETRHYCKNVWQADPQDVVKEAGGGPVGLAWFSPDCKHFSKAKGGRPAKRHIRDLAWVVVLWAKRVRPRVILLENVEEFRDWGPLTLEGKPCPERKGQTFKKWMGELRRLGYKVEWRELRACDYGAPTIRKRLFLVARCDGNPIVWPEPTHGASDDPDVIAGNKKPWRTAAEIIDWSLPCPSIFEREKPLADATCRRIARGLMRYVIEAERPFIIHTTHHGADRIHDPAEPLKTVTGANRGEMALVTPYVTKFRTNSTGHRADEPLHTVTASSFIKRPGGSTPLGVVVPTLIQTGYGERPGQEPRVPGLEKPLGTVVAGGVKHALVAAVLDRQFGKSPTGKADAPVGTTTTKNKTALVAAFLAKHYGGVTGHGVRQPIGTVTTADHHSVVAAYCTKFSENSTGHQPTEPLHTVMAGAPRHGVVTSHIVKMKGSNTGHGTDEPLHTVTSGGLHFGEVRAFLMKYYGTDQDPRLDEPLHTVTTKDRFAAVTVEIDGETYAIADIGMRMLQPHELFAAQGFPDDYIINPEFNGKPMTKTNQVRMAGNSVCPPIAAALVRANVNATATAETAVA